MKRTSKFAETKKLRLETETIRELDATSLGTVLGGMKKSDVPDSFARTCSCCDC